MGLPYGTTTPSLRDSQSHILMHMTRRAAGVPEVWVSLSSGDFIGDCDSAAGRSRADRREGICALVRVLLRAPGEGSGGGQLLVRGCV